MFKRPSVFFPLRSQHDEFAGSMPVAEQEFIFIRLCVLREVGQIKLEGNVKCLDWSGSESVALEKYGPHHLCSPLVISVPGQRADHGQSAVPLRL